MTLKRKKYTDAKRSTRDLILDIAEQEVAANGVEGLRLKDIAEQVGVQLPSLYAHFSGRKEVLEALADRAMDELLAIYDGFDGLPPREALLASADRTVEFYVTKRGYARLLLADFPSPYEYSNFNKSSHKIQQVLKRIDATIQKGVEEGTVRDIRADVFLSFRMGVTLFPLFMRSDPRKKEVVSDEELIDQIRQEANRILAIFIAP